MMLENIRHDLRRSYYRKVGLWRLPLRFLSYRGFRAVALYRMANWCYRTALPGVPKLLVWINEGLHGCFIHYNAEIGPGLTLPHPFGVVIGTKVKLERNAQVFQGAGIGPAKGASPVIGRDFTAYPGAQIHGGLKVGDRVSVGANCTLLFDVESDSTVAPSKTMVFKNAKSDE